MPALSSISKFISRIFGRPSPAVSRAAIKPMLKLRTPAPQTELAMFRTGMTQTPGMQLGPRRAKMPTTELPKTAPPGGRAAGPRYSLEMRALAAIDELEKAYKPIPPGLKPFTAAEATNPFNWAQPGATEEFMRMGIKPPVVRDVAGTPYGIPVVPKLFGVPYGVPVTPGTFAPPPSTMAPYYRMAALSKAGSTEKSALIPRGAIRTLARAVASPSRATVAPLLRPAMMAGERGLTNLPSVAGTSARYAAAAGKRGAGGLLGAVGRGAKYMALGGEPATRWSPITAPFRFMFSPHIPVVEPWLKQRGTLGRRALSLLSAVPPTVGIGGTVVPGAVATYGLPAEIAETTAYQAGATQPVAEEAGRLAGERAGETLLSVLTDRTPAGEFVRETAKKYWWPSMKHRMYLSRERYPKLLGALDVARATTSPAGLAQTIFARSMADPSVPEYPTGQEIVSQLAKKMEGQPASLAGSPLTREALRVATHPTLTKGHQEEMENIYGGYAQDVLESPSADVAVDFMQKLFPGQDIGPYTTRRSYPESPVAPWPAAPIPTEMAKQVATQPYGDIVAGNVWDRPGSSQVFGTTPGIRSAPDMARVAEHKLLGKGLLEAAKKIHEEMGLSK